jgi:hypothetical protein
MSKYYAYLRIFGEAFDGYKFQSSLPIELRGEVRKVKRVKNGIVDVVGNYWRSDAIVGENAYPDEEPILRLVNNYSSFINEIKTFGAEGITLEVVGLFTSNKEVSGLYLSNKFIKTMAEFDMHLDVDQYGHIGDDKDGWRRSLKFLRPSFFMGRGLGLARPRPSRGRF